MSSALLAGKVGVR